MKSLMQRNLEKTVSELEANYAKFPNRHNAKYLAAVRQELATVQAEQQGTARGC